MRSFRNARALTFYVASITLLGGIGLMVGAFAYADRMFELDYIWLPFFAGAVILSECFPVRLWRGEAEFTVSAGFTLALLWLAGPAAALLVQAAAILVAELVARRSTDRMAFNLGQLSLSWLAAAAAMDATGGGGEIGGATNAVLADVGSVAFAGAAFSVTNLLLSGIFPAIVSHRSLRGMLNGFGRVELGSMVLLIGFAPVIVVTIQHAPLLLPLLAFPLAGVQLGGKALMRSEHQALHDNLTGLANRDQMRRALTRMVEQGPVAVLFADLDRFKDVNDSLGHAVGDQLLCRIAGELQVRLPEDVLIARMAGDEFAVLAPGAGLERTRELAREIHALLRGVPDVDGMRLEVGASIGVAMSPDHGLDADVLIKRAEIAMYEAKQRRNDTALYRSGTDEAAAERLHLLGDLRRAIIDRAIDVHYQPKLHLQSGRICGVEALARWTHPERGPIAPNVFIPLAETGGLIGELGSAVLELAVAQLAQWRRDGLELQMAVNLSVRRLLDEGVVEEVAGVLARHDLPATVLELEITESVFLDDPERAQTVLRELSELGVSLAVDDYGTGYSSLAYLRDLPISTLKLDRAFIGGILRSETDEAIVASTLLLARSLNLRVVAEGIEDTGTLLAVERLGCDEAQGYFIGRPQPAGQLTPWLRDHGAEARPLPA
jgi:diguanylate cyclase (GGDEF)-like protein